MAEKEVRHADGASYLLRVVPYRTQMAAASGVVITLVDITNLRRAEKQLAQIVESSNDAIFAKTLEGTILTWNRAAEAIYGYPAEEAVGRNVSMLVPPDRMSELAEIVDRVRRGESITALETERVAKDGRKISVSLSLSPMRDASGQIVGVSTIARDITEQQAGTTGARYNRWISATGQREHGDGATWSARRRPSFSNNPVARPWASG